MRSTLLNILVTLPAVVLANPGVNQQIASLEASNSKLLQYPTQFTQNIMPKSRFLSSSSFPEDWRDVPLLSALSYGVASVEADVFLINGTLFVEHDLGALTKDRTFDSLYIQPLLQILRKQNPQDVFTAGSTGTPNGVFDTAGDVPLQLLVDIKTDGVEALPFILKAMQPLRDGGFLTTYTNGTLTQSAVIVIGTGNSPLEQVKALAPRDFFDAPLSALTDPSLNTTWDPTLSPIASTDYQAVVGWSGIGTIPNDARNNMTQFVNDAHSRGIKARFWDTPAWPVHARENVWKALLEGGADWLNADDLAAASSF